MSTALLESFELDGIRFVQDIRLGRDRGESAGHEFILVKTNTFLSFYRGLQQRQPKRILEVGMFEGGSLVLFDKLYWPEKLVGVDIRPPISALEEYRKDKPHVVALYGLSQDDPRLPKILGEHFPEGIDLIVDDASHQYSQSRATFHLTFPLLRPGGLYVLEDWSWSHKEQNQAPSHPWHAKPALTNLVLELVVNMPGSLQMGRVTTYRDMVVIEKAGIAKGPINLDDGRGRLRGRDFPLI